MRAEELCCDDSQTFDTMSDLLVEDVLVDKIINLKLIRIHLKVSKMDQFREGVDICIARIHCNFCPVAAPPSWLVKCEVTHWDLYSVFQVARH